MTDRDWDLLIHRHLEGALTEEEGSALSERLRTDARVRRRLAEMAFEQAQYRDLLGDPVPEPFVVIPSDATIPEEIPARARRRWILPAAAAAAFLVASAAALFFRGEPVVPPPPPEVAKEEVPREGARIEVSGAKPAVYRLRDGSRAELAPASAAVFRGPVGGARQVVELSQGSGTFAVAKAAGAFRIETPAGNVTVLGTEFTVELRKTKRRPILAVAVASGRVAVEFAGKNHFLAAGEKRVFGEPEVRPVDPFRGFEGRLRGRVVRRDEAQVFLRIERVLTPVDGAEAMVGRHVRLMAGRVKHDLEEFQTDKLHQAFLSRLENEADVTLELRYLKADVMEIVALDPEQAERALRAGDRKDEKKPRDPRRPTDRGEKDKEKQDK